ncbi:Uncharacterized protein dnm_058360 [Desulfonema magnum]|uniref:Uncharacterized protein n=1 Tax=Desulfonema magnum TaxID=45655 RepID=A0A975BQ29_9BACT|nr:Uncharacterized protein dnm_058360 [Desulfonema magnum]
MAVNCAYNYLFEAKKSDMGRKMFGKALRFREKNPVKPVLMAKSGIWPLKTL